MIAIVLAGALQFSQIGDQIWQNECKKDTEKLVFWNAHEAFPSLGIGHFIWLPEGSSAPFEETFPKLVLFLKASGVSLPAWMQGPCPWKTREEFLQASSQIKELRALLQQTVPDQVRFLFARFAETEKNLSAHLAKIERLKGSTQGLYALLDYLNFKGSGLSEKERYAGKGWGLLQVLEEMTASGSIEEAPRQFSEAADHVLKRRVANAPSKNEERYLRGWLNRVESYCGVCCK